MSRVVYLDREELGKEVREAWVFHCLSIGDRKPSHIAPWEELSEQDKEADRVIGERVAEYVRYELGKKRHRSQPCYSCGKFLPKSAYTRCEHYEAPSGAYDVTCPHCGHYDSNW